MGLFRTGLFMAPRGRRRWLLVVLGAATLGVGLFLGGRWLSLFLERHQALRLARQGQLADAEPVLQRALARDPDDYDAHQALAHGYFDAGQLDKALSHANRSCALRPEDAGAFRLRM